MTKSTMSKGFSRFAKKTTKGSFDEARQAERTARGIQQEVGDKGHAIVSKIICDEAGEDGDKHPYVAVELTISTPEKSKGKKLFGSGLRWDIRDSKRTGSTWTAEDAFGAVLAMLEDLGLPQEISKGYSDFQECLDWFEDEPRSVAWEIQANNYTDSKGTEILSKQISAFAVVDEADIPSADSDGPVDDDDPDASYCSFRNVRHKIMNHQDGEYELLNMNNQRERVVSEDHSDLVME